MPFLTICDSCSQERADCTTYADDEATTLCSDCRFAMTEDAMQRIITAAHDPLKSNEWVGNVVRSIVGRVR